MIRQKRNDNEERLVDKHPRLMVETFGYGKVLVMPENRQIRWRTQKTEELFCYLVDHHDDIVIKDVLIEELWPDKIYEKASKLFHTTLSYMRKTLAENGFKEILINYHPGYGLNMEMIMTDVERMQKCVQEESFFESYLQKGNPSLKNCCIRHHVDYLANIDSLWVEGRRQSMILLLTELCSRFADYYEKTHDFLQAAIFWEKYHELSPFSEKGIINLMRIYNRLGDRIKIKNCYETAKENYQSELNIEIGSHIEETYNVLIR